MSQQDYSFWDKVIYSIFSLPIGMLLGILGCWILSHFDSSIDGFGIYALATLAGVIFTTLVAFLLPAASARVLTFIIKL